MASCKNDCKKPPLFPRPIFNRPGLARIDYRIGTFSDFRAEMLDQLDQNAVLAPWSYRGADDPGIALIESAAVVGDILTFYQELYANELYLPTATLPQSISGLVRLIGYRLSPGVGGNGVFAFEVSGAKPVEVPAGFPVTADVTGLPDPATFETTDAFTAIPALSKFALYQPFTVSPINVGTKVFAVDTQALTASGVAIESGDKLMLIAPGGTGNPYRQVAVVDKVEARFEQTEITVKGAWFGGAAADVIAYKLGRSFRHFGYNAPPKQTVVDSAGKATQEDVDFQRSFGTYMLYAIPAGLGGSGTISMSTSVISSASFGSSDAGYNPVSTESQFPLDREVDDLPPGVTLLISFEYSSMYFTYAVGASVSQGFAIRKSAGAQSATLTLGALTGASTVVRLDQTAVPSGTLVDIRSVQIQESLGGPFTLTAARSSIGGPTSRLFVFGNGVDYQALDGRQLQFQRAKPAPGEDAAVEQATAAITASAVGDVAKLTLRPVTLQPALQEFTISEFPLSFPPGKPPVWVYGNLAAATQGKTEKPIVLGNGDARSTFQTFPIPKTPLTYLLSKSATPPEVPELVITVDGLEWTEVPSLIGYGPKDQVYIVREDSTGQSLVQFGDSETGARLSSGVGNVACTYRTGNAAFGPLNPGASADAGARLTGLDNVYLLDGATGGTQSEAPEKARQAAPGKIQSLGRMVSIRDYETETLLIPGVSSTAAAWQIVDGVPAVGITVLMETGRAVEIAAVTELLANYNVCRGPQRFPIIVIPGQREWVYVDADVALASQYQEDDVFPEIAAALADLFSVAKRRFGGAEYRSRIEGVIQDVPGVLWTNVSGLGSLGVSDEPKKLVLPATPRTFIETVAASEQTMLALDPAHLTLTAVAAAKKAC